MGNEWKRVEPDDGENCSAVYLNDCGDGLVGVAGDAFGEHDTEKMVFMEAGQLRRLAAMIRPTVSDSPKVLTKAELARVVVQALYNMAELPSVSHPYVLRRVQMSKVELEAQYDLAIRALGKAE
jgi:hypothetical protein